MTEAKNIRRLIIVLVTVLLGCATSLLYQIVTPNEEAPLYRSTGKLIVRSPIPQSASGNAWNSQTENFYLNVIETILSEEVKRPAMDKAFALTPRLKSCEVHIKVRRIENSEVLNVITTCREEDFVSTFLDALLDEFVAFRMGGRKQGSGESGDIVIQERASSAARVQGDRWEDAVSGAITGAVAGLVAGLLLAFAFVRPDNRIQEASSPVEAPDKQRRTAAMKRTAHSLTAGYQLLVWGVVFGSILGLMIQVLRVSITPQGFRSLAKIVAARGLDPEKLVPRQVNDDYYGTIIETLESSAMKSAARKRVKAQAPEVKDYEVDVRVAQTRGSALFWVVATGSEPKYTRMFLDALLDEFMILRERQAEEAGLDARNDVAIQERATIAAENVEDWSTPLSAGTLVGALFGGLLGFLAKIVSTSRRGQTLQAEKAS